VESRVRRRSALYIALLVWLIWGTYFSGETAKPLKVSPKRLAVESVSEMGRARLTHIRRHAILIKAQKAKSLNRRFA
jgi:hypothetical protein